MRTNSLYGGAPYGRSRTLFRTPAALGGGALLLLALALLVLRLAAPNAFYALVQPLWSAGDAVSVKAGVQSSALKGADALARENDQLSAQNAALAAQNAALVAQVADLTNLLGTRKAAAPGIVAGVLAGPPVAPYDVLIIDQGASAGVVAGATAFGPGGTPLGRVSVVDAETARVLLYSSPGAVTDAWAGGNRVPLALHGIGAGAYDATVQKTSGIAVGDGIFVAGPGALPIGVVTGVDTDPSSPQEVVHIRPYVNPFSVTWVTISRGS